jgi:hypothetical protein
MPRTPVLIAASLAAIVIVAGAVFAVTRDSGADQFRPLPDHALAGSHDMGTAFAELARRAGIDASLPGAPRGGALWVVAVEPGPPGSNLKTLVLDYYFSDAKPPKEVGDLGAYAGPRVQVIYRPLPGSAPTGEKVTLGDGREATVVRSEGGAVYYVPRGDSLIEVRAWSTSDAPAPSADDLLPLLTTL